MTVATDVPKFVPVSQRILDASEQFCFSTGRPATHAYLGDAEFRLLCDEFQIPLADAGRGLAWGGLTILRVYQISHLRVS